MFAYLRFIIESFPNEEVYDSLTYTLLEKGLSARVTIKDEKFSGPVTCAVELFEKSESKQLVLLISREEGDIWEFNDFLKQVRERLEKRF